MQQAVGRKGKDWTMSSGEGVTNLQQRTILMYSLLGYYRYMIIAKYL